MKKALLFVSLFTVGSTFAQDCSKIFISEYVEGWSNNKALEIYNPTNQPVDLSEYVVARYSNGSNTATVSNAVQLSGIIPPHDVYVGVLDKRNPAGTGNEAPVWDSLAVKADGWYSPVYTTNSCWYWNGNDAIVLFKGTLSGSPTTQLSAVTPALVPIDVFGKLGEGTSFASLDGWSTTPPHNTGQGVFVTADHSLIRKPSILKGQTNPAPTVFNPLQEWDSIPAVTIRLNANGDTIKSNAGNPIKFGNWESLGSHTCNCNPLSVDKVPDMNQFNLFPNPSEDGTFNVTASAGIQRIVVINSLGQTVKNIKANSNTSTFNIGNTPGVYIVKVETGNGSVTKRVIVK